jgi:hypothetical protein
MRMKPVCIREMTSSFPLMKSGDGRISREIGPTPVGAAPDAAAEFELRMMSSRPTNRVTASSRVVEINDTLSDLIDTLVPSLAGTRGVLRIEYVKD